MNLVMDLNHIENININNPVIRSYWGSINPLFYNAWNYDTNEPISLCNGLIGDSNLDGEISVLDIVLIVNHIIGLDFLTQILYAALTLILISASIF